MIVNFEPFSIYIALAVNGIFTGLGCALGNYMANKHIIDGVKNLKKRIKKKVKKR